MQYHDSLEAGAVLAAVLRSRRTHPARLDPRLDALVERAIGNRTRAANKPQTRLGFIANIKARFTTL